MSDHPTSNGPRTAWRQELPALVGTSLTLREPVSTDRHALTEVFLTAESVHFGLDGAVDDDSVARFIEQAAADRIAGRAFTYATTLTRGGRLVGCLRVRGLDPFFENAECEASLIPPVRGSGLFLEAAELVATFLFGTLGSHRLESRVLLENARANAALRKIGANQEGVLRRAWQRDGRYYDQVLWSLLRSDWQAHRPLGMQVH
ncbi:MAG: GNAT family N-acetyltransferase [Vicinamibacterales bacterium]